MSDAGDAELDDGDVSALIGIRLEEATAFGRICGRGPLGTTEADDDLCLLSFGLGVRDIGSSEATWGGDGEGTGEGDRGSDGEGEEDDDEADEERSDGDGDGGSRCRDRATGGAGAGVVESLTG
jgi:hypothetical protein